MNNISSRLTSDKELVGLILSGDAHENRALWNLSLVLLEIAEKRQRNAMKTESHGQFNVEDMVSGKTDLDSR